MKLKMFIKFRAFSKIPVGSMTVPYVDSPPLDMAQFDCGIVKWYHPVLASSAIYKAYAISSGTPVPV